MKTCGFIYDAVRFLGIFDVISSVSLLFAKLFVCLFVKYVLYWS